MDIIFLYGVRAETVLGWYDHERTQLQEVQLDLEIGLPTSSTSNADELTNTIDYDNVVRTLRASLLIQRFRLLETLSQHIATLIIDYFGSPWVKVSVTKLGVLDHVQQVGVQIERSASPSIG